MTSATNEAPREPKYYTVKLHLLDLIATLAPGSLVPTERLLAAELQTSRTTVRQALIELVGEGRLVRRHGSGTYVAEPKVQWSLQMTGFTEQAAANGFTASAKVLAAERVPARDEIAERLGLERGAACFRIERLRLADDTPMAVETAYLSAWRFPSLTRYVHDGVSLYRLLAERYGVTPVLGDETIETAPASPREATLLGIDTGAPMLVLGRNSFSQDGKPIEFVRSWYRGDRYVFVSRITNPG